MDNRDNIEIKIGGIFGIIAIVAAICEYRLGEAGALAGCIKDIAGTAIVVVLLFASFKVKPLNLEGKLADAVDNWGERNAPLIFKAIDYIPVQGSNFKQGFKLLQNPVNYIQCINNDLDPQNPDWVKYAKYDGRGLNLTGKFINMPSYEYMTQSDFDISIVLNQSHFQKSDRNYCALIEEMKKAFNKKFQEKARAAGSPNALEFTIHFQRIHTRKDINCFVNALDFILSLVKVIA